MISWNMICFYKLAWRCNNCLNSFDVASHYQHLKSVMFYLELLVLTARVFTEYYTV